jgi:hypothetical protein
MILQKKRKLFHPQFDEDYMDSFFVKENSEIKPQNDDDQENLFTIPRSGILKH